MDFRILGPLEVYADGDLVPIGGAKPRALLAVLLLHANEVVSNGRLIDALWGDDPPETAVKALQVHVSQLRKAIGTSVIATRPSGYVLEAAAGELDLDRFEQLHDDARDLMTVDPERARGLLGDALALWRGRPLADFEYAPFARAEIARLEELRLAALEDHVATDLAVGRHSAVTGALETLIDEYPLRERLRGQLMLSLYRSGRQAEALEAYQDARRALTEELGIEPSRELRELQQRILSQARDLDLPAAGAAEERVPAVFVGRERELAALVAALDDALAGRGRVVLLSGEPGIGKSRLADELIGRARARGARVIVGRCWEAGGAPAYWPWIQSLRAHVSEAEPEELRLQLGDGGADLAQLLPELRGLFPDLPEPLAPESEGARFRLFEATSSFVLNMAKSRPLIVVLDDLHAADEPSLLLLQFLARLIGDSRLLVVCAFRDVDPTLQPPLVSAVAQLVREHQTRDIALGGLCERDIAAYIELSTGVDAPSRLVQAIASETEGNPLFVSEVVRLLDADGRLAEGDAHLRIPPGVRAVITQRVGRLSEECRRVLVPAAVLGREFGLDPLVRLVGLPQATVLNVLDEAMLERVVGEAPGSSGRLRFAHALIRDTLYEEVTLARRLELHRAAGEALEAAYSADLEPRLAELAHHFVSAAPAGPADKAVDYSRRAGDHAVAQLAYEEGVRLYGMGLDLVDDGPLRCELLLACGEAQARAGNTPAAKATYRAAAELASRLGLSEELGRAALGYSGRLIWEVSRDDEYVVPLMEAAIVAVGEGDSVLRSMLLTRFAAGPLRDARFPRERQISLARAALEMARRTGDAAALVYALDGYIPAVESPANTADMLELATELLGLATDLGDKERVIEAHEHRLGRLMEFGRMPEARTEVESIARLARELRQPSQLWLADVCAARLALLEGRFAEAESLIPRALTQGERAQSWNATVAFRLQLYLLRREQGRLAEVSEVVRRSVDEFPGYPVWRCAWSQVSAELGMTGEARRTLDSLTEGVLDALRFGEMWLVSVGFLAEAASALDDAGRAPAIYERLLPYADRVAVTYPEICTGAVARYLGLLAAASEHWSDAERHFEDALALNERIGALPWLALTLRDYAATLLRRAGPGDPQRAERLLDRASAVDCDLD